MIKKKLRFNMAYYTLHDPLNKEEPESMVQLFFGTLTDEKIMRKIRYANQDKSVVLDHVKRFEKTYNVAEKDFIELASGMTEGEFIRENGIL